MPIPDYDECMLPVLRLLDDGDAHTQKSLTQRIADHFGLSEEERQEILPSGKATYIANRVGWAVFYMKTAGLIENPSRGSIRISSEGRKLLTTPPQPRLDRKYLMTEYPRFADYWRQRRKRGLDTITDGQSADLRSEPDTPDEAIESAYQEIRDALADALLERIMQCSPAFFERLVIDLLVAMGYGGAIPDAGRHLGKSGDGGIDGIINEDKLGLDAICVQAKRWKDTVGRPPVQGFAGSMEAHRAKKGVMITTSTFSKDAHEFVDRIERKIVLIDGKQLAQLMIEHNIGVSAARTYTVKKIDKDYFMDGDG